MKSAKFYSKQQLVLTVQPLPPLHLPNHHPVQALEQLLPAGLLQDPKSFLTSWHLRLSVDLRQIITLIW